MKFISIITLFLTTSLFSMPSSLVKDITNDLIRINQEEKENVRNPKFWFDYANTKTNRIDPFGEWGRWLPNVFSAYILGYLLYNKQFSYLDLLYSGILYPIITDDLILMNWLKNNK